jgi:hypothetical protein
MERRCRCWLTARTAGKLTSRSVMSLQDERGEDSITNRRFRLPPKSHDDSRPDERDKNVLAVLNWDAQCSASAGFAFALATDLTMSSRRRAKRSAAVMTES